MSLRDKGIQDTFLLTGVVAVGLGVRLVFAFITKSWVFPADNNFWEFGYEMGRIASSLASGGGFSWPTDPPTPNRLYAAGLSFDYSSGFLLLWRL